MLKKAVSLLLAFLLMSGVIVLASCGKDPVEESSGAAEESSMDEGSRPDVDTEGINKIDNLLSGEIDRTKNPVNVVLGRDYTTTSEAKPDYPDGAKKLTDGKASGSFDTTNWVGYNPTGSMDVVFDLGEVVDGICDFNVTALRWIDYAIGLAGLMTVFVSSDGTNYDIVGTVYKQTSISNNTPYNYELKLPNSLSARYIKFSFATFEKGWLFLGEVEVLKYEGEPVEVEDTEITSEKHYGPGKIEYTGTEKYWPSSDSDYNDRQNLLTGLVPDIHAMSSLLEADASDYSNRRPVEGGRLTDGKYAQSASYSDNAFFSFTRSLGREVIFDLGALSAVDSYKIGFLKDSGPNVQLPTVVAVFGSANGEDWQSIHTTTGIDSSSSSAIVRVDEQFDKTYKLRYIKFTFIVSVHVWCDEIEVYGTKKIGDNAAAIDPDSDTKSIYPDKFITPEDFGGVNNMLLAYNCLRNEDGSRKSDGLITLEYFLPHVGYYDTDGNLKDTLFDSFLFLPYTAYNYTDYAKSLEGWKFYVENHFLEGSNIDALNEATKTVKDGLKLDDDYKSSVFMSILYTFPKLSNGGANIFGDIDGDGTKEDFSKIEDRKKAIKWIIDIQLEEFNKGNYENLDFKGFYWFEESISYEDPHEIELITYARDYVHSLGYVLIWIPYYQAKGYTDWATLGFDLASHQPNYAFNYDIPISRLYTTAKISKLLGMCVEIEAMGSDNPQDIKRFKEYLAVGAETDYMDAVKIYYQGGIPGTIYKSYISDDPYVRTGYDALYLFAKGKYDASLDNIDDGFGTPKIDDKDYQIQMNKSASDTLAIEGGAHYTIKLAESPKYGTLKLEGNGQFIYNSMRNFAGTDTFKIYVDYGYGVSEETTITINVE